LGEAAGGLSARFPYRHGERSEAIQSFFSGPILDRHVASLVAMTMYEIEIVHPIALSERVGF
jgi:hypothetical protein